MIVLVSKTDLYGYYSEKHMILINGQPLAITVFPDNTSQVWKLPLKILRAGAVRIDWRFSSESEIMHLAQLKALLDLHKVPSYLLIRYLPYGRQDKEVSNQATFALRTFASILNSMHFDCVEIIDPHSSIATDLIVNSVATQSTMISELWNTGEYDLVCYPDKGANSKYSNLYDYPHIFGNKMRDQSTGNITGYTLVGECYGKNVLIVDDICDGGATFKILTKDLLANGAKSVALFVTHGIFSKGVRTLIDSGIARVFTADGEVTTRND